MGEKEKFYQRITSELEKSNQTLSQNFEEANSKGNRLETNYKAKCTNYENLQRDYDILNKRLIEAEKQIKSNKEIFDRTNFEKTKMIDELESQLRQLNRTSKDTISKL